MRHTLRPLHLIFDPARVGQNQASETKFFVGLLFDLVRDVDHLHDFCSPFGEALE